MAYSFIGLQITNGVEIEDGPHIILSSREDEYFNYIDP